MFWRISAFTHSGPLRAPNSLTAFWICSFKISWKCCVLFLRKQLNAVGNTCSTFLSSGNNSGIGPCLILLPLTGLLTTRSCRGPPALLPSSCRSGSTHPNGMYPAVFLAFSLGWPGLANKYVGHLAEFEFHIISEYLFSVKVFNALFVTLSVLYDRSFSFYLHNLHE